MAIFRFFKMVAVRHLGFQIFKILTLDTFKRVNSRCVPNFMAIGRTVALHYMAIFRVFFQNGGRAPSSVCYAARL